jgi:hypothetical protein
MVFNKNKTRLLVNIKIVHTRSREISTIPTLTTLLRTGRSPPHIRYLLTRNLLLEIWEKFRRNGLLLKNTINRNQTLGFLEDNCQEF